MFNFSGIIYDKSLKENPCVKDVIKKLIKLDNNLIKTTIGKFIKDPEYNLRFRIGDCPNTDDACTSGRLINSDGEIVITLEDTKQSTLGIAALLIHEGIHAEMHRFISRHERGIALSRPRLLQLYAFYKGWSTKYIDPDYNWKNVADHIYMVERYVKSIASTIRKLDNYRFPLDYYMDFGWDGLRKYGYTTKKLTEEENKHYAKLKQISTANSEKCQ